MTTLYRLSTSYGNLLYIGIAENVGARLSQHRETKPWWPQVSSITVEDYPTRQAALDAERAAIKAEAPLHNVVHNGPRQQVKHRKAKVVTRRRRHYPVRLHDHPVALVALPEYHAARAAIDALAHASERAEIELGQEVWIDVVADFASTNVYATCCRNCREQLAQGWDLVSTLMFPYRLDPNGAERVACHYLCPRCNYGDQAWYHVDIAWMVP